ncbi:cryptochrome DASH, chloroplastic/mitochondrial [Impatiens glandulifera]|uniref:cryptochrome DASH, chloroplastic/mitochondrial n=1 Tax=Impatiens glandulifera TaxID=253017 RepID=UPI001FB09C8E|nr:cryptochrome DASH, chloroplastic/mitochondrial [Impatiens glandulifera]
MTFAIRIQSSLHLNFFSSRTIFKKSSNSLIRHSSQIQLPLFSSSPMASSSSGRSISSTTQQVPTLSSDQMDRIADDTIRKYSLSISSTKRTGKGIAIVWFRNDLRLLDNEALVKAWFSSETLLPVYCIDPRLFGVTHYFGFPKTGALRAQFLIECLQDLRKNLMKLGSNLLIRFGKPEEILPSIAGEFGVHTIFAHKETCSEEVKVERLVSNRLQQVILPSGKSSNSSRFPRLQLIWGSTMYHIDDIPFDINSLPDVYTQFRKAVESKSKVRKCIEIPASIGPSPNVMDWGCIPTVDELGIEPQKVTKGMIFVGGESAALSRVHEYFWKKDLLKIYKETRNGMLGPDYSTKLSMWLASGSLSPRYILEEVRRYEKERLSNDSTYWVLFELIWRDYFRFLSLKYGNSIFHEGGPRKLKLSWSQDQLLFKCWKDGQTGYPLVDANMLELSNTGFMSNRGRQIVCSFLVRDMGLDWRMGAEWFETCLLDYDPCSNYGNWTYGAGVGNDPREDRYFSIPKQATTYDRDGEYVAYWLPVLSLLPKDKRHFPGSSSYIKQVVPLKYGMNNRSPNQGTSSGFKPERNHRY